MTNFLDVLIYYSNPITVPDSAFEKAGRTMLGVAGDIRVSQEILAVTTREDLINVWNGVASQCRVNNALIRYCFLYTHASKEGSDLDGLEFAGSSNQNTLTRDDILALAVLPFQAQDSELLLAGCNTGVTGTRGWSPAQAFRERQVARDVVGRSGYAYFSKDEFQYVATSPNDTAIYLNAYRRMRNGMGGGEAMEDVLMRR